MSDRGKIRRVFPGGNTSLGFYSLYEYILPQEEANRIFILKGGPGVGKSTFITKIGEDMIDLGIDIEYHHCSSDNDSLDGILIPSIKVALIDGTAPHVVDPKNPGAVDEIINLGEYWDESKISPMKDKVLKINKQTGRLFKIAYSLLKEAKVAYDECKSYVSESIDQSRYNEILKGLLGNIFQGVSDNFANTPKQRHLFASAITPGGIKNYVSTIINSSMRIYALEGEFGSGIREMLAQIAQTATEKGLFTQQFHCPFEPDRLDMVIIPDINTAIINISKPFHNSISQIDGVNFEDIINLNVCMRREMLEVYEAEFNDSKKRFYSLLTNAIEHLAMAKTAHDAMEKYYIPAMDFKAVEEKRQEILKRILKYINNTQ